MFVSVENRDDVFCNTPWVALGKKKIHILRDRSHFYK
jgi:hypothetical protein